MGLFVGIGIVFVWNLFSVAFFTAIDKAALNSDKAVQAEGSLTSSSTMTDGYGGIAGWFLHYEFHVPQPRSFSSFNRMTPAGKLGACGGKCTGKVPVSQAKYNLHTQTPLPKDCVVRYVAADPRRSVLHSVGDDVSPMDIPLKNKIMGILFGVIFGFVFFGISVRSVLQSMDQQIWGNDAYAGFLAVVGLFAFMAVLTTVRARLRLSPIPGCKDPRTKDCILTKLDTPYQKPSTAVQPAAPMMAQPAVEMMAVQCPDGVAPGTPIQIALPNGGAPMTVQVPAGVAPGQTFQVAVPAAPVVAAAVVVAAVPAV